MGFEVQAGQRFRFTSERMLELFTAEELAELLLMAWGRLRQADEELDDAEGTVLYPIKQREWLGMELGTP